MTPEQSSIRMNKAAKEIGVSASTLRKWVDSGLMESTRLPSGERRVTQSEVDRMKDVVRTNDHLLNDRPAIVVEARQKTTRDIRDNPERAFVLMNLLVDEIERLNIVIITKFRYCGECDSFYKIITVNGGPIQTPDNTNDLSDNVVSRLTKEEREFIKNNYRELCTSHKAKSP